MRTDILILTCCLAALALVVSPASGEENEAPKAPGPGQPPMRPPVDVSRTRGVFLEELAEAKVAHVANPGDSEAAFRHAELLYQVGRFDESREAVEALLGTSEPTVDALILAARIEYLYARYEPAEKLLKQALAREPHNMGALSKLLFIFYQTNRYERCLEIPEETRAAVRLPHMDFMLGFDGDEPYQIEWHDGQQAVVPFLQVDPLPVVRVTINGRELLALIDTGADTFVLDAELAESMGVKPIASMMGMFGGGMTAEVGFGRVDELSMGGVTMSSVPIAMLPTGHFSVADEPVYGIIGTNLLKQFLATMDYPNERLILREPTGSATSRFYAESAALEVEEMPFYLQATHYMMAGGSLNGHDGLMFFVDSGLGGEPSFTAPQQTLAYLGVPLPDASEAVDAVGGGGAWSSTTFPIDQLGLGGLSQSGVTGEYGALPPGSYMRLGFIQDGLISHSFLRQYAWTLDFERMRMVFTR